MKAKNSKLPSAKIYCFMMYNFENVLINFVDI